MSVICTNIHTVTRMVGEALEKDVVVLNGNGPRHPEKGEALVLKDIEAPMVIPLREIKKIVILIDRLIEIVVLTNARPTDLQFRKKNELTNILRKVVILQALMKTFGKSRQRRSSEMKLHHE